MNVFLADPVSRFWTEARCECPERFMDFSAAFEKTGWRVALIHYEIVGDLLLCSRNLCGHPAGHSEHWRRA